MATRAMVISTATPKNGARHEIEPSWPPRSGPAAMPRPRAASNRMIACAIEPRADSTMVDSAVAMNSALPRPQPARKPTIGADGVRRAGERREHDDQHQPGEQGALRADPRGDHAGDQHRDAHHRHVAGEQQRDLARRRVELVGDRLEDRVDEADPHERDDAREGDGPDGARLVEERALVGLGCRWCAWSRGSFRWSGGEEVAEHGDGRGEVLGGVAGAATRSATRSPLVRPDPGQLSASGAGERDQACRGRRRGWAACRPGRRPPAG